MTMTRTHLVGLGLVVGAVGLTSGFAPHSVKGIDISLRAQYLEAINGGEKQNRLHFAERELSAATPTAQVPTTPKISAADKDSSPVLQQPPKAQPPVASSSSSSSPSTPPPASPPSAVSTQSVMAHLFSLNQQYEDQKHELQQEWWKHNQETRVTLAQQHQDELHALQAKQAQDWKMHDQHAMELQHKHTSIELAREIFELYYHSTGSHTLVLQSGRRPGRVNNGNGKLGSADESSPDTLKAALLAQQVHQWGDTTELEEALSMYGFKLDEFINHGRNGFKETLVTISPFVDVV